MDLGLWQQYIYDRQLMWYKQRNATAAPDVRAKQTLAKPKKWKSKNKQ